jgi:hemerythrin-like domain-containing protein
MTTKHLLAEDHRALDARLDRLVVRAQVAPPAELRAEWSAFERDLLQHLELEETEVLPAFAKHDRAEADALLAEHGEIRKQLLDLGIHLDLHCLRGEAVAAFVDRLKRHAAREDAVLYRWADDNVPATTWQRIKTAVAANGRRLAQMADRVM